MLTTSMFLNPERTRFLSSSQPIPPAPTIKTRHEATLWCNVWPRTAILYDSRDMVDAGNDVCAGETKSVK